MLASKSLIERLDPDDAKVLGLDPDGIMYIPLADLPRVHRQGAGPATPAPAIAVCAITSEPRPMHGTAPAVGQWATDRTPSSPSHDSPVSRDARGLPTRSRFVASRFRTVRNSGDTLLNGKRMKCLPFADSCH